MPVEVVKTPTFGLQYRLLLPTELNRPFIHAPLIWFGKPTPLPDLSLWVMETLGRGQKNCAFKRETWGFRFPGGKERGKLF